MLKMVSAIYLSLFIAQSAIHLVQCYESEHEPPIITEHPIDVIVSKGAPATLNCAAKGQNITISWFRNGEQVITNKDQANSHRILLDTGSLFLLKTYIGKNGKDDDAGFYYCTAKNKYGEVKSKEGALKIAMLNDEFRIRPRTVQVLAGQRAVLECSPPVGFPEPVVSWRKNEKEFLITDNQRITFLPSGNLIFSPVHHSDSGTYQCVSNNMVGERISNPARLSVYEKPRFLKKPEDVTVDLAGSVLFNCTVTGEPQPQVYWTKKGDQMPVARAFIARDNKGLRIDNIQKTDEGEYVCHARNPTGSIETSARLRVQVLPSFDVTPVSQVANLGDKVSFHCVPNGQPAPASFWSKEGDQNMFFPGYTSANNRISVLHNGTFTIQNIMMEDEGSYLCAAMNSAGSALSKARLSVTNKEHSNNLPPLIFNIPHNITVKTGSNVEIPCTDSSGISSIKWLFNGNKIDFFEKDSSMLTDKGLTINNIQLGNAGVYECTLNTNFGFNHFKVNVSVEGGKLSSAEQNEDKLSNLFLGKPGKPILVSVTENEIELKWSPVAEQTQQDIGYRLEYFCPQKNKTWITVPALIKGTTFRVKNLNPASDYIFVVRASNMAGLGAPSDVSSDIKTVSLFNNTIDFENINRILSSEQVIYLKEAKTINSSAIHLFWIVRKYRENLDGFYIKWRSSAQNNSQQWIDIRGSDVNNHVVTNLQPFTNHEFFIIPYRAHIQGVPSNSIEGLTSEATPTLPPAEVRIRMLNLTSVRVSWKPPPLNGLNGILKGFQIDIIGEGNKYNRSISTKERAASVTLFHLTPRMTYKISVAARTNAGIGVHHAADTITMDFETFEKHKKLYGETSLIFFSLLHQAWFLVLLTVLGWIILITIAVFIFMRYKKKSLGKKRNGSFIKINDGSIHVAHSALWDTTNTVRMGRMPPLTRAVISQPLFSTSGNRDFQEYNNGGQDSLYHYAQPPGDNYINKFQDDPSPYATTTIVLNNDQAAYVSEATLLRPPPRDTIPLNPPFNMEENMQRRNYETRSCINENLPERNINQRNTLFNSMGHSIKTNTNNDSTNRTPPRQTLFDFIPPPPINPPPSIIKLSHEDYEGAGSYQSEEGLASLQNRIIGTRLQTIRKSDELSQRSSLLSDEDEELQSLHDDHITNAQKKMPRMGISATFLNQSAN